MTTLLSINPHCRQGDGVDPESIGQRLESLGPVRLHDPENDAPFEKVVDEVGSDLDRIVVGGGDGTLNRALTAVRAAGVPMGILPLGTANDFARSLGLPMGLDEALDVVTSGETRRVSLGRANGRWFLNAAGIGLGPELTKALDSEKKQKLGVLAYLESLIQSFDSSRRSRAVLTLDGVSHHKRFMQITVANGIHYGGGLTVSEDASLEDDELRVLLLEPQSSLELMGKFVSLRWGARPGDLDPKMHLFSAKRARIETRTPSDVTLDGELVEKTPLECECVADAIEIYSPRESPSA